MLTGPSFLTENVQTLFFVDHEAGQHANNSSGDNAKILSAHLCIVQLVYGSIVK